jgi:hypothetical protein
MQPRWRHVTDERRRLLGASKPDYQIGVALFHAPHSARSAGGLPSATETRGLEYFKLGALPSRENTTFYLP